MFYIVVACQHPWKTCQSVSLECVFSFQKCTLERKWSPSVPWALLCNKDAEHTQTIILTHISLYLAQSHKKLRSCQLWGVLHTSEKLSFRFGPTAGSRDDISSYKICIVLAHIIGIQKNHICAYVTLHHSELYRFECTMVFFQYFDFCIFFPYSSLVA